MRRGAAACPTARSPGPSSATSRGLREAVRVRRRVAALEVDLMRTQAAELEEEIAIELEPAVGLHVELRHPAADAFRIKLRVPRRVERVGDVHAPAVAAHLHHLRPPVQRLVGQRRVRGAPDDAPDADRSGEPRRERVADVVLAQLAGSPARDVEESIRSEEHTSELQSPCNLVCRLLLAKKKSGRPDQASGALPSTGIRLVTPKFSALDEIRA